MIKVYAIIGKAGSGKDYVFKKVLKNIDAHGIVSCTSRPPREGEVEGKDYHFVSSAYFRNNPDKFLECQSFNGWLYGTRYKDLSEEKINIGVFNPDGVYDLIQSEVDRVYVIYLWADDKTRLIRQLQREGSPDIPEIFRRYVADKEDFEGIPDSLQMLPPENLLFINNSKSGVETVYEVVNFIKKAESREGNKNEN